MSDKPSKSECAALEKEIPKTFKWVVEFEVDEMWVADGFNLDDLRALEMLATDLSFADVNTELSAKVISAPPAYLVLAAQGYLKEALAAKNAG